jgi:hypothetical protein
MFMAHPPIVPYMQLFEMKIESLAKKYPMFKDLLKD